MRLSVEVTHCAFFTGKLNRAISRVNFLLSTTRASGVCKRMFVGT